MTLLILFLLFALVVSFLCSILEAVLLSVSYSYVASLQREGRKTGAALEVLKKDVDRPLAAILSLNTVAHTVGAAGVGAQAQLLFGSGTIAVVSAVMTLLILVISEIIPKTLGAVYWRQLAPVAARILPLMILLLLPLVHLSQMFTRLLSGRRKSLEVSRAEIEALAEKSAELGIFAEGESKILRNLFRFGSLRARDIMTPRTVVFALPEEMTVAEVLDSHTELNFSRIPVYIGRADDFTGYVLKSDILLRAARDQGETPLARLRREILRVPENTPLPRLLERLLDHLEHIAAVIDEFGGLSGVVTLEDVVETLLGLEIVDEADTVEDMQVLARQEWEKRARSMGILPTGSSGEPAG